MQKSMKPY